MHSAVKCVIFFKSVTFTLIIFTRLILFLPTLILRFNQDKKGETQCSRMGVHHERSFLTYESQSYQETAWAA